MKRFRKLTLIPVVAAYWFAISIVVLAAPGDLDPTFGDGGIVVNRILDIGHYLAPSSILLQPDGKILVSGQIDDYGSVVSYLIARFDSSGSPDKTFGYNGMLVAPVDYGGFCVGAGIALQADGNIVAVGLKEYEIAVQRFDSKGDLDYSFGENGGLIITLPGKDFGEATAVALQNDGKIVVVGNAWNYGFGQDIPALIARLNPDGSLDDGFGTGGVVTTALGPWTRFDKVYIQPNGKLIAFGERRTGSSNTGDIVVVRYNPDGSQDSSFGSNGIMIASHGDADFFSGAGLQTDGKIIVASWGYNSPTSETYRSLVRYHADGSVDNAFSASNPFLSSWMLNWIFNFTFQPDMKIVAFGGSSQHGSISIMRLHSDGSTDTSFGNSGGSVTPIGSSPAYGAKNGIIQPDGKILVLGYRADYNVYEFVLARYLGDPTLSVAGRVTTPTGLGLRNASVTLTDTFGNRRSVITSTLGFYSFSNIPAGGTVTIAAASRRYRFEPVTRTMNESVTEVDLVGIE